MNRNYANQAIRYFRFGEQCQINTVYLLIYIYIKRIIEMKPYENDTHTHTDKKVMPIFIQNNEIDI